MINFFPIISLNIFKNNRLQMTRKIIDFFYDTFKIIISRRSGPMFWLHKHLLAKHALNSKLRAKWLSDWYLLFFLFGIRSLDLIYLDYIHLDFIYADKMLVNIIQVGKIQVDIIYVDFIQISMFPYRTKFFLIFITRVIKKINK